jgi:hypothetical protein
MLSYLTDLQAILFECIIVTGSAHDFVLVDRGQRRLEDDLFRDDIEQILERIILKINPFLRMQKVLKDV